MKIVTEKALAKYKRWCCMRCGHHFETKIARRTTSPWNVDGGSDTRHPNYFFQPWFLVGRNMFCQHCQYRMCPLVSLRDEGGCDMFHGTPILQRPPCLRDAAIALWIASHSDRRACYERVVHANQPEKTGLKGLSLLMVGLQSGMTFEACLNVICKTRFLPRAPHILRLMQNQGTKPWNIVPALTLNRLILPEYLLRLKKRFTVPTLIGWLREGGMPLATAQEALHSMFGGWTGMNGGDLFCPLDVSDHAVRRYGERVTGAPATASQVQEHFAQSYKLALSPWTTEWTSYRRQREQYFSDGTMIFQVRRSREPLNPGQLRLVLITVYRAYEPLPPRLKKRALQKT